MKTLKEFEERTGVRASELTEEKLLEIVNDENNKDFFDNPAVFLSLLEDISFEIEDKEFKKELNTIKYSMILIQDEELLNDALSESDPDERFKTFFKSDDPILAVAAYLCGIISDNGDFEPKKYEDQLKENIGKIRELYGTFGKLPASYQIRASLADLLRSLIEKIWDEFEVDYNSELEWLDEEEDKIGVFVQESLKRIIEEQKLHSNGELDNLTPEDLSLIDITKFKDNTDE